jgi:hypothetical protein
VILQQLRSSIVGLAPFYPQRRWLGTGFFLSELADSPLVGAEVSPQHAGTLSALTFAGMAIAGAVSPRIVGNLLDATGADWFNAIAVMIVGPIASMFIRLDSALDGTAPVV